MITRYRLEDIKRRPIYKLSAYVFKNGNTNIEDTGNADFELAESDFYSSGNEIRFEGAGSFPIGNAVSKICKLTLSPSVNYTAADFVSACIMLIIRAYPYSGTSWTVTGDYYFVQTVQVENGLITIDCADLMSKADKIYTPPTEIWLPNRRTLHNLFIDVLSQIGIHGTINADFPEADYKFYDWMYGFTCRQMLGFIAMIAGGNAIVDAGAVDFQIKPLTTAEAQTNDLDLWRSYTDKPELVQVTGIQTTVTTNFDGYELEEPYVVKSTTYSSGYALELTNPLFKKQEQYAVNLIYNKLWPFIFRAFEGDHTAYPLAEYGDCTVNTFRDGTVQTFITDMSWPINGGTHFVCAIDNAVENGAGYENQETHSYVDPRFDVDAATADMTQSVGITPGGKLVTKPAPDAADYIVLDEKGNADGGKQHLRRWNSGLQEHWFCIPINNMAVNIAFGAMYRSDFGGNHAYRAAFLSGDANGLPISEISFQCAGGSNPAYTWAADPTDVRIAVGGVQGTALTATPRFALVRPSAGNVTGTATIYTRGYWK